MNRPLATISVDIDSVDLHLEGYGIRTFAPDPAAWERSVPRLLEAFARHAVRATVFVVARDADRHGADITAVAAAGHEIASHSHTHPVGLTRLDDDALVHETAGSRARLQELCGRRITGFRAPSFDVDRRVLEALAVSGYLYDASSFPTPLLPAARVALLLRCHDPRAAFRMRWWPESLIRHPWTAITRAGSVARFPVSVTPTIRMPIYHTARLSQSGASFERTLDGLVARGEDLSYTLHAIDALAIDADTLDPRIVRHPGMRLPLDRKLKLLDETLAAIAARFRTVPFADRLAATGNEAAVGGVLPAQAQPTGGNA